MSLEVSILNRKKNNFLEFGDRTSSLLSLYPHFKTHFSDSGESHLSYIETKKSFIVASEPMSRLQERKSVVINFFDKINPKQLNKRKVIFPISKYLAQQLSEEGFHIVQVGIEPIFDLQEYFDRPYDVLMEYPLARALKKRGGVIREIQDDEIPQARSICEKIIAEWKDSKNSKEFGFLNRVDPFFLDDFKRFFVLEDRGEIRAFLTASPIYLNREIIGYFFNDIIRGEKVRAGSNDLLILETMKMLYEEGIKEVRLGMCPLAELSPETMHYKYLKALYKYYEFGYSFKKLHAFKKKLNPSRCEPLYLATSSNSFRHLVNDVVSAHYPENKIKILWNNFIKTSKRNLQLKTHALPMLQSRVKSKINPKKILERTKYTLSMVTAFLVLHGLKNYTSWGKSYFDQVGYETKGVTLDGVFMGSLFHNHSFHLVGDLLSFLIFGSAVEYFFGPWIFMILASAGLWLSNPLTHLLVSLSASDVSPDWWLNFLQEKDYGSSNGVFALVGGVIYTLKNSLWLVAPFIFHALYIILQRQSLLAFHHLLAMYMGYAIMLWYNQRVSAQSLPCE